MTRVVAASNYLDNYSATNGLKASSKMTMDVELLKGDTVGFSTKIETNDIRLINLLESAGFVSEGDVAFHRSDMQPVTGGKQFTVKPESLEILLHVIQVHGAQVLPDHSAKRRIGPSKGNSPSP